MGQKCSLPWSHHTWSKGTQTQYTVLIAAKAVVHKIQNKRQVIKVSNNTGVIHKLNYTECKPKHKEQTGVTRGLRQQKQIKPDRETRPGNRRETRETRETKQDWCEGNRRQREREGTTPTETHEGGKTGETQVKLTGHSERCGEAQEQQEVKSETWHPKWNH